MKTIRYTDPQSNRTHLGLLTGDDVYSITNQVPQWTDPIPMWYALRAFNLSAMDTCKYLQRGTTLSYRELYESNRLLAPVTPPEVWAAGVTYERSRDARNSETQVRDSVYDRVYRAERPELFFKATGDRIVAPGQAVGLRADSVWMVPEPELSIVLSRTGEMIGWTIGNDLTSRDIEGENPLYLPQAKIFVRSCSIGPALLWNTGTEQPSGWTIEMTIHRDHHIAFQGFVPFAQFQRSFEQLSAYLTRDNPIQDGTVLMTGTGIVPPDEFSLTDKDLIEISIDEIGVLRNPVLR